MASDVADLNLELLSELSAGLGKFQQSQLFVGTSATSGARSSLHMDQTDNLFLQVREGERR